MLPHQEVLDFVQLELCISLYRFNHKSRRGFSSVLQQSDFWNSLLIMLFFQYLTKAFTTWSVGFFPYFEVYTAVATGIALRLDPISSVIWSVFGNFTPIPLFLWGYGYLKKIPQIRAWISKLEKRGGKRVKHAFDRYGVWFLVLMTSIIGSWTIAVVTPLMGVQPKRIMFFSFVGIALYAVATAVAITSGMTWFEQ
ncbi:small multi-drug export protein [Oscillatoria sp. CS-180]|uniref:small multi-drug export protein n=1 Tax=Oscillatoria sp. CS-180 TaxID=3021720 RepID=UPI00232DCA5B|nr:small multi-drug export protein [Oscillatoria sp. CS-180]MDB9524790.1 small multi-drug export protein [Oscillatoria sp. CS-180]